MKYSALSAFLVISLASFACVRAYECKDRDNIKKTFDYFDAKWQAGSPGGSVWDDQALAQRNYEVVHNSQELIFNTRVSLEKEMSDSIPKEYQFRNPSYRRPEEDWMRGRMDMDMDDETPLSRLPEISISSLATCLETTNSAGFNLSVSKIRDLSDRFLKATTKNEKLDLLNQLKAEYEAADEHLLKFQHGTSIAESNRSKMIQELNNLWNCP